MKKMVMLFAVVVLIVSAAGCELFFTVPPASEAPQGVTQEDAQKAFDLTYGVYVWIYSPGYNGPSTGFDYDLNTGVLSFTDFDVSTFDVDGVYSSLSGAYVPSADGNTEAASFTLVGGPVSSFSFTLNSQIVDAAPGETVPVPVLANGVGLTISYVAQ